MQKCLLNLVRFGLLFFCISLNAQLARTLTAADGLPENTGQDLVQDSLGYIWVATQNGLVRYDGAQFTVLKTNQGLSSNQVEALLLLNERKLLIGTRNGLDLYDTYSGEMLHFVPDPDQNLEANWIRSLCQRGDSLFVSSFYGLHILDAELKPLNFFPNANTQERIWTHLYKDPLDNGMWFIVKNRLTRYSNGFLKPILEAPYRVLSMARFGDSILLGTEEGLWVMDAHRKIHPASWTPKALQFIISIKQSSTGSLWFGSGQGAFELSDGEWRVYQSNAEGEQQISHNLCLSILEDKQQQIWIGTGQGLNIIDPRRQQFQRLSAQAKGSQFDFINNVEVLHIDKAKRLWLGCSDGLFCLKEVAPDKWERQRLELPDHQGAFNIDAIFEDEAGTIYLGLASGALYKGGIESWDQLLPAGSLRQLRGLLPGANPGDLWLGYSDGLKYYHSSKGVEEKSELPLIPVVQMRLIDGEIWAGSARGLYRIDTATLAWKQYAAGTQEAAIPNSMISDIELGNRSLWMSSFGGGIYRYSLKRDSFAIYDEKHGLSNPNAWAIYFDEAGNLWSSTDQGISRLDTNTEKFSQFDAFSDGLNFDDFSMGAHSKDAQGRLFFGNPEGITYFHPEEVQLDKFNQAPALRDLWLDYDSEPTLLEQALSLGRMDLAPNWTNLDLFFSGFNYRGKGTLKWEFRIDDGTWKSFEDGRLSIGRPEPGSYRLEVRTSNKDGFGSLLPYSLNLEVLPAYYETWWFRIGLSLAILLLTGLSIYWYHRRQYLKKIRQLETEQKLHLERERISRDLHDHVGAHLSRIASDLDILELKMRKSENDAELEQLIETRSFTGETIRLLRDTIWAIDQDDYEIDAFAAKIQAFLQQYLADYLDWKLDLKIEGPRLLSSREVLNLLRILQEATQNMLKYSAADQYTVRIYGPQPLILEMEDNGKGFGDTAPRADSHGLKNMQFRAEEIGGRFKISSENGVRIQIEIP